jgi:hypothetical protein
MDHETAMINAFVLPAKRARLIEFLRSPKHRGKALATLYHFRHLDTRFLIEIAPSEQHADAIATLLTGRGAPAECHLISTDLELDGRDLPLVDALRQIVGFGGGTLVSCIPGRLGYFEGESLKDRFILARETLGGY